MLQEVHTRYVVADHVVWSEILCARIFQKPRLRQGILNSCTFFFENFTNNISNSMYLIDPKRKRDYSTKWVVPFEGEKQFLWRIPCRFVHNVVQYPFNVSKVSWTLGMILVTVSSKLPTEFPHNSFRLRVVYWSQRWRNSSFPKVVLPDLASELDAVIWHYTPWTTLREDEILKWPTSSRNYKKNEQLQFFFNTWLGEAADGHELLGVHGHSGRTNNMAQNLIYPLTISHLVIFSIMSDMSIFPNRIRRRWRCSSKTGWWY